MKEYFTLKYKGDSMIGGRENPQLETDRFYLSGLVFDGANVIFPQFR